MILINQKAQLASNVG